MKVIKAIKKNEEIPHNLSEKENLKDIFGENTKLTLEKLKEFASQIFKNGNKEIANSLFQVYLQYCPNDQDISLLMQENQ